MAQQRENSLPDANKTFVDRERPQKVFEDAAFSIPADHSIIRVFYGVGGQGKTALCRELMRKTDVKFEPSYAFLRRAELDLHGRTKEDPDRLLVWIRNSFRDAGVEFPCFDLAFAIAWEATRSEETLPKFTKPWLWRASAAGDAGVEGAADLAKDLIKDVATIVPGIGVLVTHIGRWAIEKGKRIYLERTKDALRKLYANGEIRKPYELSSLLPWMLAQDLNAHLASNPSDRFVLFIDEYERVFDEGGAGSKWEENPFDLHMRKLVAETNGLLAVFFSRERLPWDNAPQWRDDLKGTQNLLGGLADKDAYQYLLAIPIEDEGVRSAIINGARETSLSDALVYPLMLDLQVEHWRSLYATGVQPSPDRFQVTAVTFEGRCQEIVRRVLRDYGTPLETTLERLAVSRRFDRQAFEYVVKTFGTALPLDQFERISGLSFVTKGDDGFLTIHNAIAETIREAMAPEMRVSSIDSLFKHFEGRARIAGVRDVTDESIAALNEAAFLRFAKDISGYAAWLEKITEAPWKAAHYATIGNLWREALVAVEKQLGPDHLDTAISLNYLAGSLLADGDFTSARPLYERAIAIREKQLGSDHPDTATCLNNLAVLFKDEGDFERARSLFERALAIWEKHLGHDHPNTAGILVNLAGLLQAQGNYTSARQLYERAIPILERQFGPDHPNTATGLNNYAGLLQEQGNFQSARKLYEHVIAIRQKQLGAEHPSTAKSLGNLGMVLQNLGDFVGAHLVHERALAILEKHFSPGHLGTATGLNNLAALYQAQGNLADARLLYERVMAIREKQLDPDHPDTATCLNNLATLLRDQRDYAGAHPLYERALAIREKQLGPDHPYTAMSLGNLAVLLQMQGDLAAARPLHERALAILENQLGSDHPYTATGIGNLATLLWELGDFANALPLYERELAITEKQLGPDHPSTAKCLNNLAKLLQNQGDVYRARKHYERALVILEKQLGSDHPSTVKVRSNLSSLDNL